MTTYRNQLVLLSAALLLGTLLSTTAPGLGAQPAGPTWLDRVLEADDLAPRNVATAPASIKPDWLTLGVGYTLVSDHVWRGATFTDYPGEGREKVSHQLEVLASLGLDELIGPGAGTINFAFWFQWYVHNRRMGEDGYLQEVNYSVSYSNSLPAAFMDYELGYTAFHFPNVPGGSEWTHEIWARVDFDDSALWRALGLAVDRPILNPYVYYGLDVDAADWGSYIELGIYHDFVLAEYGLADVPVLKDITVTPSWALGINHRYYQSIVDTRKVTNLAHMRYGLAVGYDLTGALALPDRFGTLSLMGFLEFSQRLGVRALDDKLYGGVTIAWQW